MKEVTFSVCISEDPHDCVLAVGDIVQMICELTGKEPTDATMILLTAAARVAVLYSKAPRPELEDALSDALIGALGAADAWFEPSARKEGACLH